MNRRFLAGIATLLTMAGCTSSSGPRPQPSGSAGPGPDRPNIVLVLTDDLAMNLLGYLPQVTAMREAGTTFANYTVTDSLCCPSRASMLTGKFPHNTGIFTNGGDDGGYPEFHRRGLERSTFATDLQKAGYRTALLGKYLNRYPPRAGVVPPGWSEWYVAGNGYAQYDYDLLENGQVKHYGSTSADYLTDVISAKAQTFITAAAAARTPFLVELATFAPHRPYTPALRDRNSFPDVTAPRSPAFDTLPTDPPAWLATRTPLTAAEQRDLDVVFRRRVQSVQSVDRMLGALRDTLTRTGVAGNTVVVFTSDNGYHLGEHRLRPGKQTAFDTDIHVPLVVTGPGVRAGATVARPAENIDLRPTFADLAGVPVPGDVDGTSLVPLLRGAAVKNWRGTALVEHHGPDLDRADPDYAPTASGNPATYAALRTPRYTYVEYRNGFREYYDNLRDPHQLHNIADRLPRTTVDRLHRQVLAMTSCRGAAVCQARARGGS
ncbi:sulfatase [Actinoplanes sp. N902-109]|uniref:sulfatase family protein n=1 Tax=Actinoplanes sp. (strain N902-109) TaxID=649831 RepID=UPI0003293F58|nr:sulfatase [Actinoplanes sp. N902-109]AGL19841.1 arylsulfatase [Actinoplanes sp. N902-109]